MCNNDKYVTIFIKNMDKSINVPKNSNLGLTLSKEIGFPLPCGGNGFCGKCLVKIVEGEVTPPTSLEILRGYSDIRGYRLACQVKVLGNVLLEIPYIPWERPITTRIGLEIPLKEVHPLINLIRVDASMTPKDANLRSFIIYDEALKRLIESSNEVYALGLDGIVYLVKSLKKPTVCLVDLGTSKIALHVMDYYNSKLMKEDVIINPQIRIGTDIMSRLASIITGRTSTKELKNMVLNAIEDEIRRIVGKDGLKDIVLIAIAGNSVMTSIILEEPVITLAQKPFQPLTLSMFMTLSNRFGFREINDSIVLVMPLLGGFVGGDALMDYIAVSYMESKDRYLIVDLGINTELILVNKDEVYFTSSPAGPAFEGHITSGVHDPYGAVSEVTIESISDKKISFRWKTVDGEKPRGLIASGAISVLYELLTHNIIDYSGKLLRYNVIDGNKGLCIIPANQTLHGKPIIITQHDIRELQKAIAAVKTAWKVLLNYVNMDIDELDRVYIAGTFGTSLNPKHAKELGIVPPVDINKIVPSGNLVLQGLKISIFDSKYLKGVLNRTCNFRFVNLVEYPDFNKLWIENLRLDKIF